jgi:hypothetical protein
MKSRRLRRPSERNLTIYREAIIDGRTYAEVARDYQLCAWRIQEICRQVEKYFGRLPTDERPYLTRPERDLQLRNEYIEQLTHLRQQAMLEWHASREVQESLRVSTEEPAGAPASSGSGTGRMGKRTATTSRSKRRGNVSALALAMRAVDRIFKLRGGHDALLTVETFDDLKQLPPEERDQLYLDWVLNHLREMGYSIDRQPPGPPRIDPPRLVAPEPLVPVSPPSEASPVSPIELP